MDDPAELTAGISRGAGNCSETPKALYLRAVVLVAKGEGMEQRIPPVVTPTLTIQRFSYRFAEEVLSSRLNLKKQVEQILTETVRDPVEQLSRPGFNKCCVSVSLLPVGKTSLLSLVIRTIQARKWTS